MICYKDKTFCSSEVKKHTCGRELSKEEENKAYEAGIPIAWSNFCTFTEEANNMNTDIIQRTHKEFKETLAKYNAEILNQFQDEYLMKQGPGCERILFPVLEKAIQQFQTSFIDSIIDRTVQMTKERIGEEVKLLRLAHEELLELRGYLVGSLGKFNPDTGKLENYWNSGKPEWEKKLSLTTNKNDKNKEL